MNKILLIEPPYYRLYHKDYSHSEFSLGLAYLAGSILKNTNWNVKVYNADFCISNKYKKVSYLAGNGFQEYLNNLHQLTKPIWVKIKERIQEVNPDVIGITSVSSNYRSVCNVAKIAKELNKEIKIIIGGPYATSAKNEIMSNPNIDISVIGEGENTIVQILKTLEKDDTLKNVDGIIYKVGNEILENKARKFIQNLDELAFPHLTARKVLIDYNLYPKSAFQSIMTSRGCPFECLFCSSKVTWTQTVRYRSVEDVKSEILSLKQLGLKRFRFIDDTFGYHKRYYEELLTKIKEYSKEISWTCLTRADIITGRLLSLMKDAGCSTIQMGIESGNNKILSDIKKNITVDQVLRSCNLIKKHNIKLHTFFMVGFPHETEATLDDTVNLMKKCNSDNIIYSIFTPYPFTDLYDYCLKQGLIKENSDPTMYNHQSPNNCFSIYIEPKKFRKLARKIEKMVDRYNFIKRVELLVLNKRIKIIFTIKSRNQAVESILNTNNEISPITNIIAPN